MKPAGVVQMHRYGTMRGQELDQLLQRAAAVVPEEASVAQAAAVTHVCFERQHEHDRSCLDAKALPLPHKHTCDQRHLVVELEPLKDEVVVEPCQDVVFRHCCDAPGCTITLLS